MARRHRLIAWLLGVPLLLIMVALLALSTPWATRFIVARALPMINQQMNGRLTMREVRGSIFGRLDFRGVTVTDLAGTPLATADRVIVGYRLLDFIRGKIVVNPLILEKPSITLVQNAPGEPYPLMRVFQKNPASTARSAVTVRGLEITGGTVVVTVPTQARPVGAEVRSAEPLLRTVHVNRLDLDMPRLDFAMGGTEPVDASVEINEARAEISDPRLSLRALAGTADMHGDSISLDLTNAELPASKVSLAGWAVMPAGERPRFDGELHVARLSTADLAAIAPQIPAGWEIRGDATGHGDSTGAMSADMKAIEFFAGRNAGSLRGTLAMDVDPDGRWRQRGTSLRFDNLDVVPLIRQMRTLPTVPISGRLNGALKADGPQDSLRLTVDLALAESFVLGKGEVSLPLGGTVFVRDFSIDTARVDMKTVRAMNPDMPLVGHVDLRGRMRGSIRDMSFEGRARYQEGDLPPSDVHAVVQLASHSPLHITATLTLDSLRLSGFQQSFPSMAKAGSIGGLVHLSGPLDTTTMDGAIGGAPGRLNLSGTLVRVGDEMTFRDARIQADSINLAAVSARFPKSFLFARIEGTATLRDSTLESANVRVTMDTSRLAGMDIETVSLAATTRGGLLVVDSMLVRATGLRVDGSGTLGLSGHRGTMTLHVNADSLDQLSPLFDLVDSARTMTPHSGALVLDAILTGAVDDFTAEFTADVQRLVMPMASVKAGSASGTWAYPDGKFAVKAGADSIRNSMTTAVRLDAGAEGTPAAFSWSGGATFSHNGAISGAGKVAGDSATGMTFDLDSLTLSRDSASWRLEKPARIALLNERWEFANTALVRSGSGDPARLSVAGVLTARDSSGKLSAVIENFPLADLALYPSTGRGNPLTGTVDGQFDLSGSMKNPSGRGQLALLDAHFDTLPLPEIRAKADYAAGTLAANLAILLGARPSTIDARIPLTRDAADKTARLAFTADSLAVNWLDPLLPTVKDLAGRLDGKVEISGTFEEPDASGSMTFTGGTATLLSVGVRYHHIDGKLTFSGEDLLVNNLIVRTGDEGEDETLEATGKLILEVLTDPEFDLDIKANHFAVMKDPTLFDGAVTGTLKLSGPFFATTVSGDVRVDRGTAYGDQFIQKRVIDLSDSLFAQFVDTTVLRKEHLGADPITLFIAGLFVEGLQVDLGDQFFMKSSDADIQLSGSLGVEKFGRTYDARGTINTLRGTYTLRVAPGTSRDFQVEQGSIRFLGTSDLNATLDINASHELQTQSGDPLTVMVHVGGTLEAPRIDLTSNYQPRINESEIISYLVFGAPTFQAFVNDRNGQKRSVFEQSVKSFTGVLSGTLEQSLGAYLPLDYFKIQPGEIQSGLSGTELILGKQVSLFGKPSWLKASPRLCPRNSVFNLDQIGLSLETRLTRQWGVNASLDPLRGCETALPPASTHYGLGVDVFWEKRGLGFGKSKK